MNKRAILSAVLLVLVVALTSSNRFWRWMYPIGYQTVITEASSKAGIDPLLVASVVRVESKFRSTDVSHAGAIGLMQLMPSTAQWVQQKMQQSGQDGSAQGNLNPQALANPTTNIRLGTWYIRYLADTFHGNVVAAIAAYNAGPRRVKQWLEAGSWDGELRTITDIPVGETRHFIDRVFYNYDLYKRIYGRDPAWSKSSPSDVG